MNVKLKCIRESLNLSESQISSLLNISSYKYRRFENNSIIPTGAEATLLSIMYGVSIDYLVLDSISVNDIINCPQILMLSKMSVDEISKELESNLCAYGSSFCHHINYRYIKQILNRIKKIIGSNLYDLRVGRGLSVFELSEQLNLSAELYSTFEDGKNFPSIYDLTVFSEFFHVPIQQIITEKIQVAF